MKKVNTSFVVAATFFLILLNTELSYSIELDQDDLQYQFKVLPMIIAAKNHFNEVSAHINDLIEYPNVDLAIELCKESKTSYKTIGMIGRNIAFARPGRVYRRYSQLLSQLFSVRKAVLLLLIQSCASDPLLEKPDVWNSFKFRYEQLKEQISQLSSRLEEELNSIDKSFQEGR